MSQTKNVLKRRMRLTLLASVGFAALLSLAQTNAALAATAPPLGAADSFGVLAALSMSAAGPGTTVIGDLGLTPGLAAQRTGPWTVTGSQYFGPLSLAATAQGAALSAFNNLVGQGSNGPWSASPWSPAPGVWTAASDTTFTGTITLTGLATDVWVFQVGRDMTFTGSVIMGGTANPCNVFWQIGRDATIALGSTFVGTLIASRDITLVSGATVDGRIISLNSSLTTDGNAVTVCSLALPPNAPLLGKGFNPVSINVNDVSTLTITLSNPNLNAATLTAPLIDTLPGGVVIAPTPNASTTCGGGVAATAGGNTVTLTGGSIPGGAPGTCTVRVDVTSATAGVYLNTLAAGALQTSNGNNAAPAVATLTVNPLVPPNVPPTLGKGFNPVSISAGGVSTLTIILSNPNLNLATLTAPFTDILPTGVVIAATPNASTTCGGGATVTATAGGNTVTLSSGSTIPVSVGGIAGTCRVTVNVTARAGGSYFNTLPVGALQTTNLNNTAPAIATLNAAPIPAAMPIPTLSEWGMIIFMMLVGLMSIYYLRRQKAKA